MNLFLFVELPYFCELQHNLRLQTIFIVNLISPASFHRQKRFYIQKKNILFILHTKTFLLVKSSNRYQAYNKILQKEEVFFVTPCLVVNHHYLYIYAICMFVCMSHLSRWKVGNRECLGDGVNLLAKPASWASESSEPRILGA